MPNKLQNLKPGKGKVTEKHSQLTFRLHAYKPQPLPTKGTGLIEYVLQCAISVLQLCGVSCKYPFEIILSDIRETV